MKSEKFTIEQMQAIVAEAHEAGDKAANDAIAGLKDYVIRDGFTGRVVDQIKSLCGFAWINVKPGNSRFAKYLKEKRIAHTDGYYGGVTIWVSAYNQSVDLKEAYARAYANVLTKHGIKAYSASRLD
jgi:hypothetical protein